MKNKKAKKQGLRLLSDISLFINPIKSRIFKQKIEVKKSYYLFNNLV